MRIKFSIDIFLINATVLLKYRNRDTLKSKTTPSKKSSKEEDKNEDDEQQKIKSESKNNLNQEEDIDGKSSKKNVSSTNEIMTKQIWTPVWLLLPKG